jgi:hypothetical protein
MWIDKKDFQSVDSYKWIKINFRKNDSFKQGYSLCFA